MDKMSIFLEISVRGLISNPLPLRYNAPLAHYCTCRYFGIRLICPAGQLSWRSADPQPPSPQWTAVGPDEPRAVRLDSCRWSFLIKICTCCSTPSTKHCDYLWVVYNFETIPITVKFFKLKQQKQNGRQLQSRRVAQATQFIWYDYPINAPQKHKIFGNIIYACIVQRKIYRVKCKQTRMSLQMVYLVRLEKKKIIAVRNVRTHFVILISHWMTNLTGTTRYKKNNFIIFFKQFVRKKF